MSCWHWSNAAARLFSKAQILDAVWSGAAVEEFNLTVQISAVRRAIDHGRVGPSLIRTIHGRGYLFAGEVTQEVTPPPSNVSPAGRGGINPQMACLNFREPAPP